MKGDASPIDDNETRWPETIENVYPPSKTSTNVTSLHSESEILYEV